jgi:formamidopyrimidine-DNA glycosylase
MSTLATITFNDPRRFGYMDLLSSVDFMAHPVLGSLGPEPLSDEFDALALARACRGKRTSLKVALMDQRVVAGLGNIYVSEALHRARLSPRRLASTIATRTGAPREGARRLASSIKAVLREAVARHEAYAVRPQRRSRFRVYDRENERCLRKDCRGTIRRITQAGRSTFYCPVCQR